MVQPLDDDPLPPLPSVSRNALRHAGVPPRRSPVMNMAIAHGTSVYSDTVPMNARLMSSGMPPKRLPNNTGKPVLRAQADAEHAEADRHEQSEERNR